MERSKLEIHVGFAGNHHRNQLSTLCLLMKSWEMFSCQTVYHVMLLDCESERLIMCNLVKYVIQIHSRTQESITYITIYCTQGYQVFAIYSCLILFPCSGRKEMLCGNCNGAGFLGGFMSTADTTSE